MSRRDFLLGTAGHIDHGKTSLVRALTGIDCDRLPEEKSRGITIDIGFAHLDLPAGRLGIVDVPGHERFIKNMLAGATGIDIALLIVAADDSVMPQTREHLDILQLLGVRCGAIALTKADLVDDETRQAAELEIRELVNGTFLEKAPIVPTSAKSGFGIDDLKRTLNGLIEHVARPLRSSRFRLAIDRAFVVQGHGTVVTGSVESGSVAVGDEVGWYRNGRMDSVRVRNLNRHGEAVAAVERGQRAAINLAGVDLADVRRGQELATPGSLVPSHVVTVRAQALRSARHALRHRLPVRLHLGTTEAMATLSILDNDRIEPGQWALAQLFCDEPVTAVWGQPFVVRDAAAEHTLGGGTILQAEAIKHRRRHVASLERIERLANAEPRVRVVEAVWFAGAVGLNPADLDRLAGLFEPFDVESFDDIHSMSGRLVHRERIAAAEAHIVEALGALHREQPLLTNHERGKILARIAFAGPAELLNATVDRLIKSKRLVGDARRVALADFKPVLSISQRKLKDRIVGEYRTAGLAPPEASSYLNHANGNAKTLNDIFEVAVAEGLLVRLAGNLYVSSETDAMIRRRVGEAFAEKKTLTVAEIRDCLGTTRKYAVPICEYLDKIGLTVRQGDLRTLANSSRDAA